MSEYSSTVIFVDDDADLREAAEQWLTLAGFTTIVCPSAEQAKPHLSRDFPGVLVADVKMPGVDGPALMRAALEVDRDLPVVLITGHGNIDMAVQAMQDGAYDFIAKPFQPSRLTETLNRACEKRRLVLEIRQLREQLERKPDITTALIGNNPAIERLRRDALTLARAKTDVLINGETGTGKELLARCLHEYSARHKHPFVAINCGAVPEAMFESELFGHEEGAFTSAVRRRVGKFEYAHRGTVLLDEIESLPLALQVKLLRVLEQRSVERLGSNRAIALDIRVIAASKVDLSQAVAEGLFRSDLYYRLNVAELSIPPLRQRGEDILLLFEYFAERAAREMETRPAALTPADVQALMLHPWPGNVRELKNAAERYALGIGAGAGQLAEILRVPGREALVGNTGHNTLAERVAWFERCLIEQALVAHRGNIAGVLDELGLLRRTLNLKMNHYGLQRKDYLK